MKKIGIIGIGNPLRKDDGIGIVLLQRLQQRKKAYPKNVEFVDGGTGGMDLLHLLAQFNRVLIIDAVDFKGHPGEVRVFGLEAIQRKKTKVAISTHDSDFLNVLRLSNKLKELPRTLVIFGVQPRDVSPGFVLSEDITKVLDHLCRMLHKEILILVK